MLAEAVERSLAYTGKKEILVTGGVAANKSLQDKLEKVADIHKAITYTVKPPLTGDNGAQIAWTGILSLKVGLTTPIEDSRVKPKWRLEDVDIPWRD
jgi:N6-L-threonylcarbamoyladenine synthase